MAEAFSTRNLVVSPTPLTQRPSLLGRPLTIAGALLQSRFTALTVHHEATVGSFPPVLLQSRLKRPLTFPLLVPTEDTFIPPTHPISRTKVINGPGLSRLWLAKPGDARLRLSYRDIHDSDAEDILICYDNAHGVADPVRLEDGMFPDASPELLSYLYLNNTGLKWFFADRPMLNPTIPGRCSVDVEFKARIVPVFSSVGQLESVATNSGINLISHDCCDCEKPITSSLISCSLDIGESLPQSNIDYINNYLNELLPDTEISLTGSPLNINACGHTWSVIVNIGEWFESAYTTPTSGGSTGGNAYQIQLYDVKKLVIGYGLDGSIPAGKLVSRSWIILNDVKTYYPEYQWIVDIGKMCAPGIPVPGSWEGVPCYTDFTQVRITVNSITRTA